MSIPKEQLAQWSREHIESLNLTDPLEYIAQRAVEWERERLAKLAGEPVGAIMEQAQVFASAWAIAGSRFDAGDGMEVAESEKESLRKLLADQIAAAIVRAEDAVTKKLHPFKANATTLEKVVDAIPASINEATLMQRITELESQLAQCKDDAERYRWLTDDHPNRVMREQVDGLASRIPVMGKGAIDAAIDAARQNGGNHGVE